MLLIIIFDKSCLDVQLTTLTAFDAHIDSDQEREERLNYLDQYSCRPPPFFLLALSFAQVIIIQIVLLMILIKLDDDDE